MGTSSFVVTGETRDRAELIPPRRVGSARMLPGANLLRGRSGCRTRLYRAG
jgi:hypothetical protein